MNEFFESQDDNSKINISKIIESINNIAYVTEITDFTASRVDDIISLGNEIN